MNLGCKQLNNEASQVYNKLATLPKDIVAQCLE